MSTQAYPKPPPQAHPAATCVLTLLQRRFQLASERGLEAAAAKQASIDYLEALKAWLDGDGPAPVAFRSALHALRGVQVRT